MKLALEQFRAIVRDTVLVSLDLLLINERDEVLVGRRTHGPARDYYFVPGGRVMKGETLAMALQRVAKEETGLCLSPDQVVFHGIYDHIYDDSYFEDSNISTQYVVIACRCAVSSDAQIVSDLQHESLHFVQIADITSDPKIHPYTRNYFCADAKNLFLGSESTRWCRTGTPQAGVRQVKSSSTKDC
ncbi:MAG: NUDIX domain-containing protein [Desulfosporosinus sp.]|nr:NUDIX domain-containing protein [Desulfosporosinus sp.]